LNKGASQNKRDDYLVPVEQEASVIALLKTGDRDAFATLYGWYAEPLFHQAIIPRCPNRELAEDCLRDTFRSALENIEKYKHGNRSIFFWLRRIAINKAMDVHRRSKRDRNLTEAVRTEPTALPPPTQRPDRRLEVQDTQREVNLSLSKLNPRYAKVLRLRLIEGRSREECAEIFGVTVGNLDVILHRAAKAFRKVYPP
jgi:RNA polymerase sigma-70 factor (ECF subfamily)